MTLHDSHEWTGSNRHMEDLKLIWPEHLLDSPPEPGVPDGYILRQYTDADEQAYLELTHEAGFTDWGRERLHMMLPKIIPGGLFVIEHQATGKLVATAFCKHNPSEEDPSGGELGWVAGDPDHKGKGLGLAVCAAVTARFLQAGYRRIYIRTQDWRLPALKTYLKLGYVPVVKDEDMAERWRKVLAALNWPG